MNKKILNFEENISFINNRFQNISLKKHFHEEYSFSLIYEGDHLYENEKDRFKLNSGVLQVVNPYEFHTTYNSTWSYLNLTIKKEFVDYMANNIFEDENINNIRFYSVIKDKNILNLFYTLYVHVSSKNKNDFELESILIDFFTTIIKNCSSNNLLEIKDTIVSKNKIIDALRVMDDKNSLNELSLDNISNEIGISKYHFIKEFKKVMGITPNQYLQIKKINFSKSLMQSSTPFSNIAYECGFTDQSYMIKVFKSFYGYTPNKLNKI